MVRGFESLVENADRLDPSSPIALRLTLTPQKYPENYCVANPSLASRPYSRSSPSRSRINTRPVIVPWSSFFRD